MTTPHSLESPSNRCPVAHSSPIAADGPRVPLYTEEFAADPRGGYERMRAHHRSFAPVELAPGVPATLVIGYQAALRILNDPEHFPADPRAWQRTVPADSPILPMLGWRPNALRSTGAEHARFRAANVAAIDGVDLHTLHTVVERVAIPLINSFSVDGRADLLTQYIRPLAFTSLNTMLGIEPDIAERVAAGLAPIFDVTGDAAAGNRMLAAALQEHTDRKRAHPGDDITSRLIAHESALDDEEVINQLVSLYGAGIEPQLHLVANALLLMMTDERFSGNLLGGTLTTRDALDWVLFNNPPLANYCASYPRQPMLIDDVWLPANQPVLIGIAACNNDPQVREGDRNGNRSHLSLGAGPHACPARRIAYLIAQDTVDQLLDALPDIELAVPVAELRWRPGPFNHALAALPVTFPPSPPLQSPFA
ncbi:Cytochrome P450 monooxygenase PikC [Nocardia cerradoensis]|uniref:Cytochrome P450 monooxygenase PikC n=1 Tax=Nocardia cerradoensis TaxID=85688 RepID=A0A231HAQ6_9NOCA|nr:Cytochrome P450 monooxygenase PikC [Nocardia cerradoensis]